MKLILSKDELNAMLNEANLAGWNAAMSNLESATESGFKAGHREGFNEGYDAGRDVILGMAPQPNLELAPPVQPPTKEDLQFATDDMPNIGVPYGDVGDLR